MDVCYVSGVALARQSRQHTVGKHHCPYGILYKCTVGNSHSCGDCDNE